MNYQKSLPEKVNKKAESLVPESCRARKKIWAYTLGTGNLRPGLLLGPRLDGPLGPVHTAHPLVNPVSQGLRAWDFGEIQVFRFFEWPRLGPGPDLVLVLGLWLGLFLASWDHHCAVSALAVHAGRRNLLGAAHFYRGVVTPWVLGALKLARIGTTAPFPHVRGTVGPDRKLDVWLLGHLIHDGLAAPPLLDGLANAKPRPVLNATPGMADRLRSSAAPGLDAMTGVFESVRYLAVPSPLVLVVGDGVTVLVVRDSFSIPSSLGGILHFFPAPECGRSVAAGYVVPTRSGGIGAAL